MLMLLLLTKIAADEFLELGSMGIDPHELHLLLDFLASESRLDELTLSLGMPPISGFLKV